MAERRNYFGRNISNINVTEYHISSNLCRIFRLKGVHKMFGGGPIFRGWNEFLLLGKALKFGVICQKYALKLIKNSKNIEKILEKNALFSEDFLIFFGGGP